MAVTHSHRVVTKLPDGAEMKQHHLTSDGKQFGHDVHEGAGTDQHTHEDVWEVYDRATDSFSLVSVPPEQMAEIEAVKAEGDLEEEPEEGEPSEESEEKAEGV